MRAGEKRGNGGEGEIGRERKRERKGETVGNE